MISRNRAVLTAFCLLAGCKARETKPSAPVALKALPPPPATAPASVQTERWCAALPRPANSALRPVRTSSTWFHVYQAAPGVFALVESEQYQEAISYLIIGTKEALMFDTGIGVMPIRPVVTELTKLPITVINSHSHYDHVGGNHEFDRVLSMDTPFTRMKMAGRPHAGLAGEVAATAFCQGPPAGLDTATFRSQAWKSTGMIHDGSRVDLGGRTVEVIGAPGHTPDGVALLDRRNGLLFTGDNFYDSTIWLYAPETSLDDYITSMTKLVALTPAVKQLLPAHNTARVDPSRLAIVLAAAKKLRTDSSTVWSEKIDELPITIDGVKFLTSRAAVGRH